MNLLISACLMGIRCRYDGGRKPLDCLDALANQHVLIPVCPEVLGGLPTPRVPAERIGDRVITKDGRDVTENYQRGAEEALRLARMTGCTHALLKERSPSCGCGVIYDGTFSGGLCTGDGVCGALLKENGLKVLGESRVQELLTTKTEWSVRRAEAVDLDTVTELALRLWPDHEADELWNEMADIMADSEAAFFLLEEKGQAKGFAQCQLRHDYVEGTETSPVGYLEGIYVCPETRGQGGAKALLKACERWAASWGCTEFASDCELDNAVSHAFHMKMGFEEASRNIHFSKKI